MNYVWSLTSKENCFFLTFFLHYLEPGSTFFSWYYIKTYQYYFCLKASILSVVAEARKEIDYLTEVQKSSNIREQGLVSEIECKNVESLSLKNMIETLKLSMTKSVEDQVENMEKITRTWDSIFVYSSASNIGL